MPLIIQCSFTLSTGNHVEDNTNIYDIINVTMSYSALFFWADHGFMFLSLQVQWAPTGTVSQVLQVDQDPLVFTEQRVNKVILASLVSLGCAIHPCAMAAWWGGILTAKGQSIDVMQRHDRQQSGADVEQTAIPQDDLMSASSLCRGNKTDLF